MPDGMADPELKSDSNEASSDEGQAPDMLRQVVSREHSWAQAAFIFVGLSMCISVDILQYSMPLAFLPSVLEDRGHAPMTIATAIGVYYWTGFAGGVVITGYQMMKLMIEDPTDRDDTISVSAARKQIRYLIYCLGVGTITLCCQAMHPHVEMHTACRFVQGMAGAFIFFYAFLLSATLFSGQQQVAAMTAASTALNVAEVLGSTLGALIFDTWGQRAVFWVLVVASIINQVMLLAVIPMVVGDGTYKIPSTSSLASLTPEIASRGIRRLRKVLSSKRMGCSVILIVMAAIVKASVEEVLPFHADHRWGLQPIEIGQLFSVIAIAYISSAVLAGQVWEHLREFRVFFGAFWLAFLGLATVGVFLVASLWKDKVVLYGALLLYGLGLGLTHTPAALLLADAVDHEKGRAKEAVNAIWNTMWEAGGSTGFFLGGFLAHDYARQLQLFTAYVFCCFACAAVMMMMMGMPSFARLFKSKDVPGGEATLSGMPPVKPADPMSALKASLSAEAGYGTNSNNKRANKATV